MLVVYAEWLLKLLFGFWLVGFEVGVRVSFAVLVVILIGFCLCVLLVGVVDSLLCWLCFCLLFTVGCLFGWLVSYSVTWCLVVCVWCLCVCLKLFSWALGACLISDGLVVVFAFFVWFVWVVLLKLIVFGLFGAGYVWSLFVCWCLLFMCYVCISVL